MKICVITFRSVTPAQRGEKLLRQAGIGCTLGRTPRWMEEQGCGYSLRLPYRDLQTARLVLNNSGVPFRKVYLTRDNGTLEEAHGLS